MLLFGIGMLIPFGFAPFHLPGAAILGMSLFYSQIQPSKPRKAFFQGLAVGVGMFGIGVSWVSISIHTYGHIPIVFAYLITSVFIVYLALFPALCSFVFKALCHEQSSSLKKALLFSSLWCITEYVRGHFLSGFPWLLLGFGQIDTPLQYLLPITGIYGLSFLMALASCCLAQSVHSTKTRSTHFHVIWLLSFVMILILPISIKNINWSTQDKQAFKVGVIQANLSMRDKWDETLFWKILDHYHSAIQPLLDKKQLIILPESAIPLPASYIQDFLSELNKEATAHKTAILYGVPEEISPDNHNFYNTLATLGQASGKYRKQHLVPFGEYLPPYLSGMLSKLELIMSEMQPGNNHQPLVQAHQHPFATLICYELAYPNLLRLQLPEAQWIVSLSDDGWFGRSLASYQHLQMAQALSILSGRYQIVANNDGLSSIITPKGRFNHTLPAFTSGILEGSIYPAQGTTPWIKWGDQPVLGLCVVMIIIELIKKGRLAQRK